MLTDTRLLAAKIVLMGIAKTAAFDTHDNRIALYAKALSHPARVAIVKHLMTIPSCVCGELVLTLPLSQSTVSQHLKALKNAGIIQGRITGTQVCYCLNQEALREMAQTLQNFLSGNPTTPLTCCS
jgi:ArsR family transcriptional regulator, arsenate/arsenite/antimonite-responsive transcriptional repressor